MPVTEQNTAFVVAAAAPISLSQIFTVTAAASNPAYLVLNALDRAEYTVGATGATGSFSGNNHTLGFSTASGDGRGAGIVFSFQSSTGRYYNSIYGFLDQLTFVASSSMGDVTNLSLFGVGDLSLATADAADAFSLMQDGAAGYLGSATVVTQPMFAGTVPSQATPSSIAATALSFVGQAVNLDGCWVLASAIAAEAGTSLPIQSTLIGRAGQPNGEWFVAFNGPAGQPDNWQSMVKTGEVVVIGTPGGGGHITTCVSGSGRSAMLVDNVAYSSGGRILNAANDGSASDVIVSAPHQASQEWAGVQASSVVIYALDTPVVTVAVGSSSLQFLRSMALAPLFSAADPMGKAITAWQLYDTAASDSLMVNTGRVQDHTATTALSANSLADISLVAGATSTTDTLDVRAFNGTYWGDWTSIAISIGAAAPSPPVLVIQTAGQTWKGGAPISLTLPFTCFTDPQAQALRYTATLANGGVLPSWLSFNDVTRTLRGFAPTSPQTMTIVVTATDTSGLSASDTFSAKVLGLPVLTVATPRQTWSAGAPIALTLPANSFTDPQGQNLLYSASLSNGQPLPSWLRFDATSRTFSGTAPSAAQSLSVTVTATDTSGCSGSESFTTAVRAASPSAGPVISVTAPMADQTWTAGQLVDLVLPSNTFTNALGLRMTFKAYDVGGGLDVTSWLHFNRLLGRFSGAAPISASGTETIEVIATDGLHPSATDLFNVTLTGPAGRSTLSHASGVTGSIGLVQLPQQASGLPLHF